MAYVVKVKIQDVERALAEVRPGHRLVQVCSYIAQDAAECAAYEAKQERWREEHPRGINILAASGLGEPPIYQMRDLYFEEEPKAPKTLGLESMFRFDRHGNLCVVEAHL